MRSLALPLVLLVAVLTGCSTAPEKPAPGKPGYDWPYPEKSVQRPAESDAPQTSGLGSESGSDPVEIASAPAEPLPDFPRSAEQISGSAVAALLRQARDLRAASKPEQAQGRIERALKIEPRNYFAWSALAATYLDQRNYEQAASIAGKSNSLARGNIYVELENYRILQEARQALGQSDAAFQARARADEIQQRLERAEPGRYQP